jgi:hypothetical protein
MSVGLVSVERYWSEPCMVSWTVMFGEVVGEVDSTGCPEHVKLALVNAIAEPVEAHVDCLRWVLFDCGIHDSIGGVGGCAWPNSISVFCMGMLCLAFKKSAAISASAAEDITFLMMLAMTEMDPLNNF